MKMYPMEKAVNQMLWEAIMKKEYNGEKGFENEVFVIRPYRYDRENDWNFWFKPGDVYLRWCSYPLWGCECNMELTHEEFYAILEESMNSVRKGSIVKNYERWWEK